MSNGLDIVSTSNFDELQSIMNSLQTGDLLLCDNLTHKGLGYFSWLIKFMSYSDYSHIGMIVKDPQFTIKPLEGVYVWQSGDSSIPDAEDGKRKIGVQITPFMSFVTTYPGKIYLRRLKINTKEKENVIDIHNNALIKNDDIYSHFKYIQYSYLTLKNIILSPVTITRKIATIIPSSPSKLIYLVKGLKDNSIIHAQNNLNTFHNSNPFTPEICKQIHSVVYDKPYDIIVKDWIEAYCQKDPNPQKINRFWCSALVGFIYTKVGLFPSSLDWSILSPSFFSQENNQLQSTLIGAQLLDEELIWCIHPNNSYN